MPDIIALLLRTTLGLASFVLLATLMGERRRSIQWRTVGLALAVQTVLAWTTLKVAPIAAALQWLAQGIAALRTATLAGTSFAFGYVGGGSLPFATLPGGNSFVFALQALPMVIVVSALSMLLFHWRILPIAVRGASWIFSRLLGIGGALGVCTAAKLFLGQTEAPLLIRPYMGKLTRSELFTVMTLGMATTSSSVMVIYATILERTIPHPIRHILTASLISLPAAVAISRVMVPPDGPSTDGSMVVPYRFSGAMEAVSRGASDGMKFFTGILAMLITTLALVSLADSILGNIHWGDTPLSLKVILGVIMSPVAWLMGVPWSEARLVGNLLGEKTALNEVIAFISFAGLEPSALSERSRVMLTYALCGFANFSSIGIQIGGFGNMMPERRGEVTALAPRALVAGTLASLMSATLVGMWTAL